MARQHRRPGAIATAMSQDIASSAQPGVKPPLMPNELDSWIAVTPDGKMLISVGNDNAVRLWAAGRLRIDGRRVRVLA